MWIFLFFLFAIVYLYNRLKDLKSYILLYYALFIAVAM